MIAYFDTSAFFRLIVSEPGSERPREIWQRCTTPVSSLLLYTECRAALAMAHRMGRLHDLERARREVETLWFMMDGVNVTPAVVRRGGQLAEQLELRGYDAVHLASAECLQGPGLVFVSSDKRQREAASALGIQVAVLE